MKSLITGMAMLSLVVLTGCTQGTPGGPGTTENAANKPVVGQTENTFNLSVPLLSSSIQQGNVMEATIGIDRAKNFDQDVTLKFADVPAGVTIEPASPEIKHGDKEVKITVKAVDEAVVGDYKIKVVGHPTKGGDAQVEFKLGVAAKDSFTVSVPLLSTSLKQGEKKTVAIKIKRQNTFDEDVTLGFGELPTGVTVEPTAPVIKSGNAEVEVTFTAAADAALGDFTIQTTGHPAKGADASSELKLTVVKE